MTQVNAIATLELRRLDLHAGRQLLAAGISFSAYSGELLALTGRNGTGKTTLLRTIAGLIPAPTGSIFIRGSDLNTQSVPRRASLVAVVTTDRPRLAGITALQCVIMGAGVSRQSSVFEHRRALEDVAARFLDMAGAGTLASKPLSQLSDGELQRVLLARALAQDTPLLLLDEPTAFLDSQGRSELMELLVSLADASGKTIVLSTHEMELARRLSHRFLRIENGRLTED
jgi:iron complex transport system ATP-binding protein